VTTNLTRRTAVLGSFACLSLAAGCGLPRPGPNKKEIFAGSVLQDGDAFIVTVNARVTRATAFLPSFGFSSAFKGAGMVGSDTLSAGDTLAITIFENVRDDPLLGNTGQRVSALTEVQVDGQGYIFIPYAGKIKAAGQTVDGVRQAITRKLDEQTPDPQVTVSRLAGDGSSVTIAGSVAAPGVYPIERPTRTLASMLAKAGGVSIEPALAIATVGGLQTSAADPTGVFVFRNEPAEIANVVLGRNDLQGDQRMVYVLDLTQPTGMFEARDFLVRDGDTVYVTEAPYVQWTKTLSAITGVSTAAGNLATASGS
jgi:protein involved in polysaccharide export with SLBB domain